MYHIKQHLETLLDILLPSGYKEWILLAWDVIGIYMIASFSNGGLHTANVWLEFGIKALTFLGLLVTLIIKLIKLFKKKAL